MDWLQGIGTLAFIVAGALWWTWLSFSVARWVGRLLGRHLPITPRALALRPWIRWSKPLLLASGFGVLAGPISYIAGWGIENVLSGADWVLYGGGCFLNLLVGLGRGTAQRLGVADEPGVTSREVTTRSFDSRVRMWINYVYGVLVVVTAIGAMLRGAIWPGAAGLIGPLLCWWAGSGVRGSFMVGSGPQKIGGLVAGAVFAVIGLGALYLSGYRVTIFSFELSGVAWGLMGAVIGFICTTREAAEGRPPTPVQTEYRVDRPVNLDANREIIMDEQVQSLRVERAKARGHRQGYVLFFHLTFVLLWVVAGSLLAGAIWVLATLLKVSLPIGFPILWLSAIVLVCVLTLPRFVPGSRRVRIEGKRLEMKEWMLEAGEDLLAAGFTQEQIERKLGQADVDEIAKLVGTLQGLKQGSSQQMTEQQWYETVVFWASPILGEPEGELPSQSVLATKVTYSPGKYSQVKLADGSRYLVEVLNDALSVRTLKLAAIPGELVWKHDLRMQVRTPFTTTELAQELLDLVLDSISRCQTYAELYEQLNGPTESALMNYFVGRNKQQIYDEYKREKNEIFDELNESGVDISKQSEDLLEEINRVLYTNDYKEDLNRLVSLFSTNYCSRSVDEMMDDADVISDFGGFLETHAKYTLGYSETMLPHGKTRIAEAFIRSMIFEKDHGQLEILQGGYIHLSHALPDPHGSKAMRVIDEGFQSVGSEEFRTILALNKTNYDVYNELRAVDACRYLVKQGGGVER